MSNKINADKLAHLGEVVFLLDLDDWQTQLSMQEALLDCKDLEMDDLEDDKVQIILTAIDEGDALIDALVEEQVEDRQVAVARLGQIVTEITNIIGGKSFTKAYMPDGDTINAFLAEHVDFAAEASGLVLQWEQDGSETHIEALRRLIHTIKGEAGMLQFDELGELCHKIEDVLDHSLEQGNAGHLLTTIDRIDGIFLSLEDNGAMTVSLGAEEGNVVESESLPFDIPDFDLETSPYRSYKDAAPLPEEADADMVSEFLDEAAEHLHAVEAGLLALDADKADNETIDTMFRAFHTIKGLAGFMNLEREQRLTHRAEDLLDAAREGSLVLDRSHYGILFATLDTFNKLCDGLREALESGMMPEMPDLPELLHNLETASGRKSTTIHNKPNGSVDVDVNPMIMQQVDGAQNAALESEPVVLPEDRRPLGEVLVDADMVPPETVVRALRKQQEQSEKGEQKKLGEILVEEGRITKKELHTALAGQKTGKVVSSSTMKVDVTHVDGLGNAIGELVIAQNMLTCLSEIRESPSRQLQTIMSQLTRITRTIQDTVTSLRMVPVRPVFQRMNRVARDLGVKIKKEANFIMEGGESEIDKSLVDRLGDPLVHLVRNAIDHGIELPADRVAVGKQEKGRVMLRAFRQAGHVHIEIQDDGKGLDRSVIVAKAIERGLIQDDVGLSDEEVWSFIFNAGFSTATEITDVSGRGVGMDVVRRMVEDMRGTIRVHSVLGTGTTVSLIFPLTLAIIDGMMVSVAGHTYIIPTLSIHTSLHLAEQQITNVGGGAHRLLDWQEHQLPLFALRDLFDQHFTEADANRSMAIIVSDGNRDIALEVDAILGRQQVVLKPIDRSLPDIPGIGGSSITGEGHVCLVVDIAGLVAMTTTQETKIA